MALTYVNMYIKGLNLLNFPFSSPTKVSYFQTSPHNPGDAMRVRFRCEDQQRGIYNDGRRCTLPRLNDSALGYSTLGYTYYVMGVWYKMFTVPLR